jgi:hypothetical protein
LSRYTKNKFACKKFMRIIQVLVNVVAISTISIPAIAQSETPSSTQSGQTYDVAADFLASQNPSGAWSYGYKGSVKGSINLGLVSIDYGVSSSKPSLKGKFIRYDVNDSFRGVDFWRTNAQRENSVFYNSNNTTHYFGTGRVDPGKLGMHPGSKGEYSIARWTAQKAGTYSISATFSGIDQTTTDVHVLKNGSSLFDGEVSGLGDTEIFSSQSVSVNVGDTIDFAVGYGSNGNYYYDSTGLEVTINEPTQEARSQPSTPSRERSTFSGPFTNTTYSLDGNVTIDLQFEQNNKVSGYINFTNHPGVGPLCGAGNFQGTLQGSDLMLRFVSKDPDPGCGSDQGLVFIVNATLSPDGSRLEDGTYQINNSQAGVFQAASQTQANEPTPTLLSQGVLNGGGIAYSDNMALAISTPEGWDFDPSSGSDQGMLAVMYPHGSSWTNSNTAIYVRGSSLKNNESLKNYIERDIERNKELHTVTSEAPIRLQNGSIAEIRIFSPSGDRNVYEAIAYITGKNSSLMLVVLTCRDKAIFDQNISGFKKMITQSSLLSVERN